MITPKDLLKALQPPANLVAPPPPPIPKDSRSLSGSLEAEALENCSSTSEIMEELKILPSAITASEHDEPVPFYHRWEATLENVMDRIFTQLETENENARAELKAHGVTYLWLPLPKHTIRRIFNKLPEDKEFVRLQQEFVDATEMKFGTEDPASTPVPVHFALNDGDEFIQVDQVLGEGAFGTVESVLVPTKPMPTICARKRIERPRQLNAQKQIMAAFAREINVMRQVDHRHCVRLLASYTDLDSVNILSTPVADMDLAKFLDRPLRNEQKKILYDGIPCLCNALNYLHQKRIRHEDLKPQNVLIQGSNILLTDFGFSLDFSDDSISTTTGRPSAWTVRYSAPEVLEFEPRNRASDIFSLGCVVYEMISGIDGHSLSEVKDHWRRVGNGQPSFARNPEAASSWLKPVPSSYRQQKYMLLREFILYMLEPDRLRRPSAQQVVDRLSDLAGLLGEHVPKCCTMGRPPRTLSWLFDRKQEIQSTRGVSRGFEESSFYPSNHWDWTYLLLDLDFMLIYSKHSCYSQMKEPVSTLFDNFSEIQEECQSLYKGASRTGATKEFWSAHKAWKQIQGRLAEVKDDVEISARLLSLKHVVFTNLRSHINIPTSDVTAMSLTRQKRTIHISLLPVCLRKSVSYGAFFYMLSFRISQREFPSWQAEMLSTVRFVDLTI